MFTFQLKLIKALESAVTRSRFETRFNTAASEVRSPRYVDGKFARRLLATLLASTASIKKGKQNLCDARVFRGMMFARISFIVLNAARGSVYARTTESSPVERNDSQVAFLRFYARARAPVIDIESN